MRSATKNGMGWLGVFLVLLMYGTLSTGWAAATDDARPGLDMESLKAKFHERVQLFLDAARTREQRLRALEDIVNSDKQVLGRLLEVISNRDEDDELRWAAAKKLPLTKDVIRQELNVLKNPKDGGPVCGPSCCRTCPNVSDCRIRPSCWRKCTRWPETCCRTMMGRCVSLPSVSSCRCGMRRPSDSLRRGSRTQRKP